MPPRGGWRKRHQQAARRRGDSLRAQGRRALYNDTVRWYAHRHGLNYQQAQQDSILRILWEKRSDPDREQRLLALDELGILTQDQEGKWRYSDAFLAWLFEEN